MPVSQAYDIPSIRGFAVSCGVVASFVGLSLMFHESFGPRAWYEPFGKAFSWVSIYTVVYAWSDAIGHLGQYLRGEFRSAEEARQRTWFLPFESSTYRYIILDCVVKKPTLKGLSASAAPSHLVTLIPAIMIAAFVNTALINVRLLLTGSEGLSCLISRYPDITRWASYNALLVVMVSSFSTFLGSMVLHRRISVAAAALLSIAVYFLPVFNVGLLLNRYEDKGAVLQDLLGVIFRGCPSSPSASELAGGGQGWYAGLY